MINLTVRQSGASCYWFFARDPGCQQLVWQLDVAPTQALLSGLLIPTDTAGEYRCRRTLFWQLPQPWLSRALTDNYPQQMVISGGKRHPLRPGKPRGEVYRRFDARLGAWVSALVHYLFLDDSRTQRVVAEPRADNAKMIGYMQNQRFHCEKEFDFPHKRAALMVLGRERFFDRCVLV